MCPQGRPFNQEIAQELSHSEHLVLFVGIMKDMMNAFASI